MPNEVIKTELTADPAGKGYAGKTHAQMETLINAPDTWMSHIPPETHRIMFEMARAGTWKALNDKISDGLATPAARSTAQVFRDYCLHKFQFPVFSRADYNSYAALLTTLSGAGVMTTAQRDVLAALADQMFSRANLIGWGYIDQAMIADALAG